MRDVTLADAKALGDDQFSSALSIKLRTRQIGPGGRKSALAMFTRLSVDSFTVLPMTRFQLQAGARFADQHALGLRAGDTLHLAVCADHGATFCTIDRGWGRQGRPSA